MWYLSQAACLPSHVPTVFSSQTDVIVNTASAQRNLDNGEISKAILQKAGKKMQEEFKHAPRQGHVIVTQAYQLQCKKVFHTFCMSKPFFQQVG